MNGTIKLSNGKLTSPGKFFCKGCNKHRYLSDREGRYGKTCKHCEEGKEALS